MNIGPNIGRLKGPTPGPDRAVKRHNAMASGVVLPVPERRVEINFRAGETGKNKAPGLTTRNVKMGMAK